MTATVEERQETLQTSNDKQESAHIVKSPNDGESHHAYVMRARIEGFAIEALCGYVWIPHKKAEGLPKCQECMDIWEGIPSHPDDPEPGFRVKE